MGLGGEAGIAVTAFLQALLGALQALATGGGASASELKALVVASLAILQGQMAVLQTTSGDPNITVIDLPGVLEPVDPDDPNSSAKFVPVTVPIPYATVAAKIKLVADQTQNESWAAGAMAVISLISMVGGI